MKTTLSCAIKVLFLAFAVAAGVATAQQFPSKTIRWVVPFPAGGTGDILVRTLSGPLSKSLGQNVIVDDRPGGVTVIGTELVARAPADGYTVLMIANTFTINPAVRPKLPYDTLKDFAGVARIATTPMVFAVHPSLPAKTFKELLALARARPGELTYGTPGTGTAQHLATETLKQLAKIDLVHVPYQGVGPAMTAVVGGHVSVVLTNVPDALPHVAVGRLRPLAVSSAERSPMLKDIPTVAELGFAGFEAEVWVGAVMHRGAPREAISRLSTEIARALEQPEVKDGLAKLGFNAAPLNSEQFDAFIRAEMQRNEKIARQANIRIE